MKKETNKPIRVLQMIASLYYGGSQTMLMNLYKKVDQNRVVFDFVIDHDQYDSYRPLIEKMGGKIFVMPTYNGKNANQIKKAWNVFFTEHPEYDILHSHSRSYASLYLPIAKKHGLKTVIHSHNTSNGKGIIAIYKNLLQYPLRKQADYFIGCSRDAGKWLFGNDIVNSERFFVLNNAIDAGLYATNSGIRVQYRKEFGLKDNDIAYLQVGSFAQQKNHQFTLDVFKKIVDEKPNCKLFFVGVGDLKKDIENKIEYLGLKDKVVLLGSRNDVNNILQMVDCYVMPSLYEGLSVAAIEAQASGVKCILSSNVSKEVKVSQVCKFLELDVDTWKEEMLKVQGHENTLGEIRQAGFDVNDTANWLTDFYERIICE